MHLIYELNSKGYRTIEVSNFLTPFPEVTIKDKYLYQDLIYEKKPSELYHTKVIYVLDDIMRNNLKFDEDDMDLLDEELIDILDSLENELEHIYESESEMDDVDRYQFTVYFNSEGITYKYVQDGFEFPDTIELKELCEKLIEQGRIEQILIEEREDYNKILGTVYHDGYAKKLKNEVSRREYAREFYRKYYEDFFKHSTITLKELENYIIYLCTKWA